MVRRSIQQELAAPCKLGSGFAGRHCFQQSVPAFRQHLAFKIAHALKDFSEALSSAAPTSVSA
jgi:hypothetical protein